MAKADISADQRRLRHFMVKNALESIIKFEGEGAQRNPDEWVDNVDPHEQYTVKKGVAPHDAIENLWHKYGAEHDLVPKTGCKKAVELVYLKSLIDLAKEKDAKNGNHDILDELDQRIGHNRSPSDLLYGKQAKIKWPAQTKSAGWSIKDLIPGDRTWVENPYYVSGHGTQGSNEIYIGGKAFVGLATQELAHGEIFDGLTALQTHVRGFSGHANGPLNNFKIIRVYQPTVPSFFA
ncbi:MAG TPA: hypothetical protein VG013_39235 [Gemmataceae bacterium]|nr:hypothetical protein [Gemmataceae bacterium]